MGIAGIGLLAAEGWYAASRDYLTTADAPFVPSSFGASEAPPLTFLVVGDSSAVGVGASDGANTAAARVAAGLAAARGQRVNLVTRAVSGARTAGLAGQLADVDTIRPQLVLILIGANDGTHAVPLGDIKSNVEAAVRRAREAGAGVVVGTCPELGARNFPVPLRQVMSWEGRRVAEAQAEAVTSAGGIVVPLGELVGKAFRDDPATLSRDEFHPSDIGYGLWADVLLPAALEAVRTP